MSCVQNVKDNVNRNACNFRKTKRPITPYGIMIG